MNDHDFSTLNDKKLKIYLLIQFQKIVIKDLNDLKVESKICKK